MPLPINHQKLICKNQNTYTKKCRQDSCSTKGNKHICVFVCPAAQKLCCPGTKTLLPISGQKLEGKCSDTHTHTQLCSFQCLFKPSLPRACGVREAFLCHLSGLLCFFLFRLFLSVFIFLQVINLLFLFLICPLIVFMYHFTTSFVKPLRVHRHSLVLFLSAPPLSITTEIIFLFGMFLELLSNFLTCLPLHVVLFVHSCFPLSSRRNKDLIAFK